MTIIIDNKEFKAGDQVAILSNQSTGNIIRGLKTTIVISKIKEDGSVYLKGEQAPKSVAFKKLSGKYMYTKSLGYRSNTYTIMSQEQALSVQNSKNEANAIREQFKNDMNKNYSLENMVKISAFIASLN